VAVHLAMSYMCYDIVPGLISGYAAMLVRKVIGDSRLMCYLV
jgi:hypothetical protein